MSLKARRKTTAMPFENVSGNMIAIGLELAMLSV
jgi:hypothetical protein